MDTSRDRVNSTDRGQREVSVKVWICRIGRCTASSLGRLSYTLCIPGPGNSCSIQRCARKRISSDGLQQGSARPSANNFPKISQRLHQRLFQTRPGDNKNIAQESQECNPSCSDLNRLPDRGCYRKVSSAPTGLQDSQDSISRSALRRLAASMSVTFCCSGVGSKKSEAMEFF